MALPRARTDPHPLIAVLPGFEQINRYWDRQRDCHAAKIMPGEYYVTRADELIVTVLGSCISACIRDPVAGIGGMNHFMLPESRPGAGKPPQAQGNSEATRYGNYAMEHMINDILKHGGIRERLEVKVFGGGKMSNMNTDVGTHNIAFVRDYLMTESLQIAAEDVGDYFPRKVVYSPLTGQVWVRKLHDMHNRTIVEREAHYQKDIRAHSIDGTLELFE